MTRVKRGVMTKKRHKNILEAAKGYRWGRKNLFTKAKAATTMDKPVQNKL